MNTKQQPRQFQLRLNKPPKQGKESALAGVAEPGDHLLTRLGMFVNNGTKESPLWEPYKPAQDRFFVAAEFDLRLQQQGDDLPLAPTFKRQAEQQPERSSKPRN